VQADNFTGPCVCNNTRNRPHLEHASSNATGNQEWPNTKLANGALSEYNTPRFGCRASRAGQMTRVGKEQYQHIPKRRELALLFNVPNEVTRKRSGGLRFI